MRPRIAGVWKGSIRRRLMIGVGGLVALLMAAFVWQTVERQRAFLETDNQQQSVAMARMLAANCVSWVLTNDLMGLAEILGSAQRYPSLRYVIVTSPDGRVLAHTEESQVGRFLNDPASAALLNGPAAPRAVPRSKFLVDAVAPIKSHGAVIGWVFVGMNQSELLRNLEDITLSGFYYGAAAIVLSSLLIAWIVGGLMRGLTGLVGLTSELAAGNASVRARTDCADELGVLNNAFNAMADTLDASNREIRESELKYREVFANVSDALFLYDVTLEAAPGDEFRLADLNPAAERMTGLARGRALGKTLRELAPAALVERSLPHFRDAVEAGVPQSYEDDLDLATGHRILSTVLLPVRDPSGSVYRLIVFDRDVTGEKQAAQELHRREQEFRALAENAPDPIFRYDRECRRVYSNPAAARLANAPKAQRLGCAPSGSSLFEPAETEKTASAIRRVIDTGEQNEIEMEFAPAEGGVRYYQTRLVPEWGLDGKVESVLSIYMDVTRLIETERSLLTLVEHLPDMVSRFDLQGRCLYANPQATKTLAATGELVGKTVYELGPPEGWPQQDMLLASIRRTAGKGEPDLIETPWPLLGGLRDFEIRQIPEKDDRGNVVSILSIARDITKRKRAEAQIAKLNRELKLRLDALKEANSELESFSYSVSHDLRIPVRAIDGYAGILLEEYGKQLAGEGERYLNVVRQSATRMLKLIDGLLEFISLSQRAMRKELVDMQRLAQEVFAERAAAAPGREITLRLGDLPPARCDRNMMRQALASLIDNALKFTGPRPRAEIEIGGSAAEKENAYFVQDNGVGFDARYMDKLFGVFLRLHSHEEFEGPGIGLAIVKRIISRHGGKVWAESTVGEGATFHFSLPNNGKPPAV